MFSRLLLVFVVLAALVGGLAFMKYEQFTKQMAQYAKPRPPATVSEVQVESSTWQPKLEAIGSVRAVQGVMVNNEVAGQVEAIRFESGDRVRTGQALVQLDTDVDEADLKGLEASLELAEIKLKRNTKLLRDRAVSQGDFDEISAALTRARAAVAAKQALIDKKTIRAPFDGVLGIRQVNLGQYLSEGSDIVGLEALNPVFVDYKLPERYLSDLHGKQPVEVRVAAYPDQMFSGHIQAISPSVDKVTRNVQVRAELKNPDGRLRPGMFAKVGTLLPQRDHVLTLPRRAVSFNTYGDSVFVIQKGSEAKAGGGQEAQSGGEQGAKLTVTRKQIRTGSVRGERVEVLSGLAEGERVVLAGHQKLRNGAEVRIVPDDGKGSEAPEATAGAQAPEASDAPKTAGGAPDTDS
ncbi:MAG: efflux RND transporter periplasmic adaptor subunit [Thiohalocapsa sp.]|jgi:membrane fusion protein (multidrug efflux system)|uniref:efflux RND transporter periplasmic adaptor subunit n=1 Tax=Thiohalocapsa sp. TaxID=2497641 RepID=UPI0025FA1F62|nr:efflux RND transporter periplasmic adaptor subunit [Thiohalocapsa sp.]MCG6942810.1 efflux RND transporter periplasmic adaptor subunit [Thiohalocapsa sp.]